MSVSKSWMLNWISNKETQQRFKKDGMLFCEVDFSEVKATPEAMVRRLFDYCKIPVENWESVKNVLSKDSQEGSSISQGLINRPDKLLPEHSREEARQLLSERGHEI